MVAPAIVGAGIATGGELLGGLISGQQSKKAAKKAYRRQKEFATHSIRWKAEDARQAGLHPLFAMGAGSANYQPAFIAGQDPMGTALSESARELGAAYAQSQAPPPGTPKGAIGKAQLEVVNSQIRRNDAEAALALSQAKRAEAAANVTQDGDIYSGNRSLAPDDLSSTRGRVRVTPAEITSAAKRDQARTAGQSPAFKRYVYGTDRAGRAKTIDIPYSDEGPLEEFGPGKAIATLLKNLGLLDERAPKFRPIRERKKYRRGRNAPRGSRRRY